jgi:uncharacterized protein YggE
MIRYFVCSLLLLASVLCFSQEPAPVVSVSGDAEVRVVPNEVILNMGIETADRSLRAAKSANDVAIQRALEVAAHHGIPTGAVKTDYIAIEPRYRRDEITGQLLGYVVRKSLTVRLSDISKFEDVFTDLLDAGVNVVHGIEFRTTELRKYRDQARALAIKAAQEKAQALAQSAGRRAGNTLSITENGGGWFSPYSSWWGSAYGGTAQNVMQNAGGTSMPESTLAPGQITVTAHVGITVALE